MPAQLPGALDRCTTAEPLGLVRVEAAQQVRGQRQRSKLFKLRDFGQQAFETDPAGISGQPGIGSSVAVVPQQGVEPLTHPGIQAFGHAL